MSLKLSSRHTSAYSRTFAFRNTQSVPLSAISNSNENVRLRACGRATTEERERERPNEGTNKRIVWLLLKLAIFNSVAGISNNLSREESLPEVYLHISIPLLLWFHSVPVSSSTKSCWGVFLLLIWFLLLNLLLRLPKSKQIYRLFISSETHPLCVPVFVFVFRIDWVILA